jgi:6-phosphogluconolactonase
MVQLFSKRMMMQNLTIFPFETQEEFYAAALEDVLLVIKQTLKNYEECRIAIAGGSTPKELYEALSNKELPWEKIKFIIIDERYAPSDDPQSNLKMIRKALLNHVMIPPENVISFDTSLPINSAAQEMDRKIAKLAHEREAIFDLIILGAGVDGHIASLFPGDNSVDQEAYASTAQASGPNIDDYETKNRLTLTMKALKNSRQALLLLKGRNKQQVLKKENTPLKKLSEYISIKTLTFFR